MNYEQARFNMIEQQIRPWEVLDAEVLEPCLMSDCRVTQRTLVLHQHDSSWWLHPRLAAVVDTANRGAGETAVFVATGVLLVATGVLLIAMLAAVIYAPRALRTRATQSALSPPRILN
jgi:hypothetical protein